MAARINTSIQRPLWLLNPLQNALNQRATHLRTRLHFSQILFSSPSSSYSSSKQAVFCASASNSSYQFLDSEAATDPFVISTPLYYVNVAPHMGSAYTTIAADAIARFQRLLKKKVVFITGTDEHGEKLATAAAAQGSGPSEHCDTISEAYKTLWKDLDVAYDKFIRTTDPKHEEIVKEFYSKVLAKGDIYRADYEGLYCVNCEEYKDEKGLLANNICPIHLKPCASRKEDNYFFALSKCQRLLEETLTQNPGFVQPTFRLNENVSSLVCFNFFHLADLESSFD